jgi:uncharacterized protein YciI
LCRNIKPPDAIKTEAVPAVALDNMRLTSGGMAILKAADLKEATKLGTDDPTVQSGMLKVEIKTFWVPFHG